MAINTKLKIKKNKKLESIFIVKFSDLLTIYIKTYLYHEKDKLYTKYLYLKS